MRTGALKEREAAPFHHIAAASVGTAERSLLPRVRDFAATGQLSRTTN
jgi:hypothetical protein